VIQTFAFYLFATLLIASGALTMLARNPVHSVLWLILAFFNGAGLMLIVGAEFIAMLLVIVYVGAVAVLFLFVAVVLAAEMIFAVGAWRAGGIDLGTRIAPTAVDRPNIQAVGELLYGRYLYIFEGAGLVLLVAMIGAIVLTQRTRAGTRPQNVTRQVMRRPQDAVRNVDQPVGQGVEL
jgi:NADH-quinone oxidoreductase subunit J